jgi:putative transposase
VAAGTRRQPRTGSLDRQAVHTTETGGGHGDDTPQHVKGRHRHLCVEAFGWLRAVVVPAARVQDRDGALQRLDVLRGQCSRLRRIWAAQASAGDLRAGVWARRPGRTVRLAMVKRPEGVKGVLRRATRWRVERTVEWCSRDRRCSTDADDVPHTSEAMIRVAMIHLMGRRLARLTGF